MGRGRGKGKKQCGIAGREDTGSGEDEKVGVRRRGRPQKPMKDEIEEEEEVEKNEEQGEETTSKNEENGRKRKMNEGDELVKEELENGSVVVMKSSVGYRQLGSRRKNKPRRAAEVGVECK